MAYTPVYTSVSEVQVKSGLTTEFDLTQDANVQATIEEAERELEGITGRVWTTQTITEFLNVRKMDVIGRFQDKIILKNYPVLSINSFSVLDFNDNTVYSFAPLTSTQIQAGVFDTIDYWVEPFFDVFSNTYAAGGVIKLKTVDLTSETNRVKINYSFGYTTPPVVIRDLATCMSAIRVWVYFMGGQYNRLNSYSIPQQNVEKGDFYDRGLKTIASLQAEADKLIDRIGERRRIQFYSVGGY